MTDIDQKMLVVSERLNLMLDKQEQLMELQNKYRFSMIINKTITIVIKQIVVEWIIYKYTNYILILNFSLIESKLDQIIQRLDSPPASCQSDGAQTYLLGPDRCGSRKLDAFYDEIFVKVS